MSRDDELDDDALENKRRRSVQSIKVGSALLDALAEAIGPLPLNELSRRAGMPPSKARRYLISFLDCGLVEQDATSGHYDLGAMALRLGFAALSRMNPVQTTVDAAAALSRALDRTVSVTVWCDYGPIAIAWYDSSEILACNMRVGTVMPLLHSASGKLYLAYLPEETTRPLREKALQQIREWGGTSIPQARKDLEETIAGVRREGVATTQESLVPGLSAVAAPVFDSSGTIVATIAEIHRAGAPASVDGRPVREAVVDAAREVSQRLGHNWRARNG